MEKNGELNKLHTKKSMDQIQSRKIKLAIPNISLTQSQADAIRSAKTYAQSQEIELSIVIVN